MKVGFIGCGNMGGALARAISKVLTTELYIYDYNEQKAEDFSKEINAQKSDSITIAKECDYIFLGVKPGVLPSVLEGIKNAVSENTCGVLVSMAAGVKLERLEAIINYPIIRIMPNTPVAVSAGMISFCKNGMVTDEQTAAFTEIMSECGRLIPLDERLIDAATAVAGCGPAFVYMFIDALMEGGIDAGLSYEASRTLAAHTLIGAAEMILQKSEDPETLRIAVCSPGGSTIEGVKSLLNDNFKQTVTNAVGASYRRTQELGK
jgi:pyrroline-5-carboxylate reductase